MHYEIHNKKLPIPSFFQVYNFGGGRGDKDREIVYSEFTKDTPALINYYYINNEYPHEFQYKIFDDLSGYDTVGDLYNVIRKELITKGELFSDYNSPEYDFNDKVFLLDSGAASIVKQVAVDIKYDKEIFREALIKHLHRYYDFAHELKFDIVVGFDLGGKYTEKDGKNDVKLKEFLLSLDTDDINNFLIEESVKYLSKKVDYYPCVLATVHGKTPDDYKACANYILELEKKYNYRFWGFALGGIASYKKLDKSWFDGISFKNLNKNDFAPLVGPAIASRIVRSLDKERPIHALGCGGYRLIKEENNVRNRNYIRIKEGIKKINRKKILILIPIMYFLIIGCLTYAGEWLLGKMGSPFSTELYLVIFYALMIVLLSAGMIGILCMLGTPIKSKKIEGQLIDIGFTDKEGNAPILLSKEKDKKRL